MSEQDNIRVVRAQFDAINAGDLVGWIQTRASNVSVEGQPGTPGPMTGEQYSMFMEGYRTAFPDLHFEVTRVFADGEVVVAHWTASGTHNGPMRTPSGGSIPPTGKAGTVNGSSTYEFSGGKIVREWAFWDMTSLLGQLGLMPPM